MAVLWIGGVVAVLLLGPVWSRLHPGARYGAFFAGALFVLGFLVVADLPRWLTVLAAAYVGSMIYDGLRKFARYRAEGKV